ncbi:hypothetical protein RHMOL_Rhmol13G0079900 [Rhododendron molle]|uniref:Uncharacterized protein n=1 Tax=Rhododendron molle TaxID=49168 RepID=A0ACC0L5N3_RHOML|nr:hypothetical protein RHMOL_Rhmol13G0079900 [Rhododendron molle]
MASLSLNSFPLQPPSQPRKLADSSCSSSLTPFNGGAAGGLKPIVVCGNPPTFVSAPGRRIVAVGDLHGDLAKARCALEIAGVLSSDGRDMWTGGETVLIQLGDILDRGGDEIAILSLLRSLDIQAKAKGGAVFQVNGNHETMNVSADFRYVDLRGFDECLDFLEYLNDCKNNWEEAFVTWVGASERLKDFKMSQQYWDPWNLVKIQSILEETLQAVGAKAMVVGHTPQSTGVNCAYGCSIWRIDVGMSSGVLDSQPEVLEIRDSKARAIKSKRDTFRELQIVDYT